MRRAAPILALLAISAACFTLSGRLNGPLVEMRRDYQLVQADPLHNSPPLVTFTTVALGGFRGILADMLWLRASKLQDEGKHFELVQLSDWITKLEPRFVQVWAFHAWNMSYNISVLFKEPEDRWRWVRHGISLLRDQGLVYNPGDAQLYRELAWLFQHKLGADMDQAHMFYKQAWAREMADLFDGPRPDFETLLAAPDSTSAKRLREEYRMDPALMQAVDDEFGPLDWRLPEAHALYWGSQGRRLASGFEAMAADRLLFQCMSKIFFEGRLFFDEDEEIFVLTPNVDILPKVLDAFERALVTHPDEQTMKMAHANFLREAVFILFTYNRNEQADEIHRMLKNRYPDEEESETVEEFVFGALSERMQDLSQREAMAIVEGAAFQSVFWRALGDTERSAGFDQLARLAWRRYMAARTDPELLKRTGLPPLDEIRAQARRRALDTMKSANARARIEAGE